MSVPCTLPQAVCSAYYGCEALRTMGQTGCSPTVFPHCCCPWALGGRWALLAGSFPGPHWASQLFQSPFSRQHLPLGMLCRAFHPLFLPWACCAGLFTLYSHPGYVVRGFSPCTLTLGMLCRAFHPVLSPWVCCAGLFTLYSPPGYVVQGFSPCTLPLGMLCRAFHPALSPWVCCAGLNTLYSPPGYVVQGFSPCTLPLGMLCRA